MKCNDAAERLLAGKDGIQRSHDGLRAHYEVDNRRLQKSLKSALEHHQAGASTGIEAALLTRPDGAPPLNVLIRPIPLNYRAGSTPVRRPAVAVFLRDPTGSPPASRALLRKLFGLTATESEIALLMIDGLTLDEAAATLGVSRNTVRAHLRGVFAKTGATRQALLVKMLLNSVAAMV
jgi:DNA-binding CsgD family transcriptional regulator